MKVTAFVKYDLYPHYLVVEGDLQDDFDVKTSMGTYSHEKVLAIKPWSEYEMHELKHHNLREDYRRLHKKLKLDLLKERGVDFIPTDKL